MSKILFISNGHGEDLSGSFLAKYLVDKGYLVDTLPIVGNGENYKKGNIRIIGKTKKFRTLGIAYSFFKEEWLKYLGDKLFTFFKKLYLSFKIRNFIYK